MATTLVSSLSVPLFYPLQHNSPVVGALLVALPGSSSYLMVQRPTGSSSNAATLINAAIMDVDTGEVGVRHRTARVRAACRTDFFAVRDKFTVMLVGYG